MITVDALVALGGKVWERGDMKRVYFNYEELAGFYGLKSNRFGATVDGEKVSNSRAAALHRHFTEGKFWYDLTTGEFAFRDIKGEWAETIIERITEKLEAVAEDTPAEEAVETEAEATTEDPVTTSTAISDVRTAVGPGIPAHMVRTNRKSGYCRRCRKLVGPGEGHLYYIDPDEAYEDSGWIVEHKESCN